MEEPPVADDLFYTCTKNGLFQLTSVFHDPWPISHDILCIIHIRGVFKSQISCLSLKKVDQLFTHQNLFSLPSLPECFVKKLRLFNWNCVKFAHGNSCFCEFWLSHRYNFKLIVFKIYCKVFCLFMNYLFCDFKIDIELAIGVSCF